MMNQIRNLIIESQKLEFVISKLAITKISYLRYKNVDWFQLKRKIHT